MRLVSVLGALAVLVSLSWLPLAGLAAAATPSAPYTDPAVVGSIGLCNKAGQQITSGSVTAQPFAWRAVSTQPAQAPYNNDGRTATLVAYQPIQGLPPGDWSGAQMTTSARYSNPANPMAAATDSDQSLQDIIEAYPPRWDGFLQLRIYLSTADEQAYDLHYPALNIQVTGDTWQAIGGSAVNCASGTAESAESVLLPSSTTTSAPPTTTTTAPASAKGDPGTGSHPPDQLGSRSGTALASGTTAVSDPKPKKDLPLVFGTVLAALVVLAATSYVLVRRRLRTRTPDAVHNSSTNTSTKGDSP